MAHPALQSHAMGTNWMLWLRGALFTMVVPGVVGVEIPLDEIRHGGMADGAWMTGWVPVTIGAAVYAVCLWRFLLSGGTPNISFARPLRFLLREKAG
jgi:hypothetical protein